MMPALSASVKGSTVIPWLSTRTRSLAERTSLVRSRGPVPAARDDADAGQPWGLRWPVVVEGGRSAGAGVELLPGTDRGAVGVQGLGASVLRGDVPPVGA